MERVRGETSSRWRGGHGALANKRAADSRARALVSIIRELRAAGFVSRRALADVLNRRAIPTARGGRWHYTTVVRVLTRLGLLTSGKGGRINNGLALKQAADARAKALAPTIRALQGKGPSGVLYAAGWHSRSTSVHRHEWATLPLSPLAHRIWLMDLRMGILFVANLCEVRSGSVVPH
jgi:hypothetical protein